MFVFFFFFNQIADVFGLADRENFTSHILSLYLHCRDSKEKCDVTLPW